MDEVARIVLAMEEHDVAEEVMHFLDRSGRARVVGMAVDDRQLLDAIRQLEPDAVIAQPSLVGAERPAGLNGTLLAVDTRESVRGLRAAIGAGAKGFFVWPADREALSGAAASSIAPPSVLERRASVIAVHAARGGGGATFVATHLSRAFARRGLACIVVDGDPTFGEIGAALGAPKEGVHTMADLVPLASELTTRHLDETLWTHPEGFRALLAPSPAEAEAVDGALLRRIVEVAAAASDVTVVALARSLGGRAAGVLEQADRIVEILTLDVLSFRAASRAIEACPALRVPERLAFVVNRASRSEITVRDVERVFGCRPLAVVASDRAVGRMQDHGRLVSPRGRAGRAFNHLAERLSSTVALG